MRLARGKQQNRNRCSRQNAQDVPILRSDHGPDITRN
jgi:hypothetical protein